MSYLELVKWLLLGEAAKYGALALAIPFGVVLIMVLVYIWWRRHNG